MTPPEVVDGRRWRAGRAGVVAAAVTAAAMVATPLVPRGGRARRVLSTVTVTGLWFVTSTRSAQRWSSPRAALTSAVLAPATLAVERIGTRTGLPFGRYEYTPALRPQVAGVPGIVPLAWVSMAVPAREAVHAALGARSTAARRVVGGAVALTAWDLFLDPQMVGEGYWRWARRGAYRGIPITNYLGWLATGLAVMAALEVLLPADEPADRGLVGEYAFMGVMETVGFAAFFRDRLVAVVGGAGMLPVTVASLARLWEGRHGRLDP